jgi:POT family proton-dependent oligopeptide transporter
VSSQAVAGERTFFGHPRGLIYCALTEGWERFALAGMQALLGLYLVGRLLQPGVVDHVAGFGAFRQGLEAVVGRLHPAALATQIVGLYAGLVYLTPVLGGLLADRLLGQTRTVILGAALMAAGHFTLTREALFLPALLLLILGYGCVKANLASQIGRLYARDDRRRDEAFAVYGAAINIGSFIAPLICGTLGEVYGWAWGFGTAGCGMVLGLIAYIVGRRHLPPDQRAGPTGEGLKLQPGDGRVVLVLIAIVGLASLYWIAQSQVWITYPLWARDHLDRVVFGLTMPVTWLQSIDALAPILFTPAVLLLWRWQAKRGREPSDLGKMGLGCALFALAYLWLGAGAGGAKMSLPWALVFHVVANLGWLYFVPNAAALFTRAAPAAINAMMVGVYFLSIFIGATFSGWMGRFAELMSPQAFWLMYAAFPAAGAALLLGLGPWLTRALRLPEKV